MADSLNVFSDADVTLLREMVNWFRGRGNNTTREDDEWEPRQAPEVYIALTPVNGIPQLTPASAAGTAGANDSPGTEVCYVYNINQYRDLEPVGVLQVRVYNLNPVLIDGSTWVLVIRDKFGKWIAQPTALGGFEGTSVHYIAYGTSGDVTVGGVTYTVWAMFGDIPHNTVVWVSWDSKNFRWVGIQIPCPTGTAT